MIRLQKKFLDSILLHFSDSGSHNDVLHTYLDPYLFFEAKVRKIHKNGVKNKNENAKSICRATKAPIMLALETIYS